MIGRRGASLDEVEELYSRRFDVFARVAASVAGDSERIEWVDVGNDDDVAIGTWKVVLGTHEYATIAGIGGVAMRASVARGTRASRASSGRAKEGIS